MDNKAKILVIDDTKINIDIVFNILKKHYELFKALDANTGLEILKNVEVDLILLDIIMPKIDGYELCKILKSNDETKNIPVIFITSKNDGDSIKKAYDIGGIDYITKPFIAKEICSKINLHLKQQELIQNIEDNNKYLNTLVKKELKKNQEQQEMLFFQSKLATMGETLNIIAHQWRQPLSLLNSYLNNMELALQYNEKVDKDELKQTINHSQDVLKHLSTTIDIFQNHLTPKKEYEKNSFKVEDALKQAFYLYKDVLNQSSIKVIENYKSPNSHIKGDVEDFIQVLVILISNAKDALIKENIQKPQIKITTQNKDNHLSIEIEDNAKGITISPIEKIFEPYVSTKGKNGFGIGLFTAKKILNQRFNGDILVSNNNDGASFNINIKI